MKYYKHLYRCDRTRVEDAVATHGQPWCFGDFRRVCDTLLFVPIADHIPEQAIHPTVDGLNLRRAIPETLPELFTIKHTVRSAETFRILDNFWGVSETTLVKRWLWVENTATGERGYLASWYTERAPTSIYDPNAVEYHRFGRDALQRIRSGITALVVSGPVLLESRNRDGDRHHYGTNRRDDEKAKGGFIVATSSDSAVSGFANG